MATKEMLPQLSELEKILEDVWFNPTSPFGEEEAKAQHGEMTAGLCSRRRQKLVQCSLHHIGGSQALYTREPRGRLAHMNTQAVEPYLQSCWGGV